ncbi:hypothetical protein CJU89_6797 [Yarrowia sp. B02]|nr:hypothetical protein CJU89_6797 [Yarrowia sp. B02]
MITIANYIARGFQLSLVLTLCVYSPIMVVAHRYYESANTVEWFTVIGVFTFVTIVWWFYIIVEPSRKHPKTHPIATIVCEVLVLMLWVATLAWRAASPRKSYECREKFKTCRVRDWAEIGIIVGCVVSFAVSATLIVMSAVPLAKSQRFKDAQSRVGGVFFDPQAEESLPRLSVPRVHEVARVQEVNKQSETNAEQINRQSVETNVEQTNKRSIETQATFFN